MVESRLKGPLTRLSSLTSEAKQLINNGTTNPNEFNEYLALLLDALSDARPLNDPQNEDGLMPNLRQAILEAEQTRNTLDDLWKKWQPLRKLIEEIGSRQAELSTDPLEVIIEKKSRSLDEAKSDLETLKVCIFKYYT
jgi:hypothetical protein